MKKLLLIALLIVGCDNATEVDNEIKDVAWLVNENRIYWTDSYQPTIVTDTVFLYTYYTEDLNEVDPEDGDYYSHADSTAHSISSHIIFQNDTLQSADSARNISHCTYKLFILIFGSQSFCTIFYD